MCAYNIDEIDPWLMPKFVKVVQKIKSAACATCAGCDNLALLQYITVKAG